MTLGLLATGLIGAVIGGVIVVWAEQWRWRRENRAAARLLFYEVLHNISWLSTLAEVPAAPLTTRLSRATWDAEGVRVASLLTGRRLNVIAAAYFGLSQLTSMHAVLPAQRWEDWLANGDGRDALAQARDYFDQAQKILNDATKAKRPWGQPAVPATGAWLGVSGGGLVQLGSLTPVKEF